MYCFNCMSEITNGEFCTSCMSEANKPNMPHQLKPGTILNNKYLVGNVLGEGGFGITYIGLDIMLKIKVAIKEYYPNGYVNRNNGATNKITITAQNNADFFEKGKNQFLIEARNVAKFNQEKGIVDVRDYFEENDTAYIVMQFLDGNTLSDYVKTNGKFDAKNLFVLMLPVMKSLEKIHNEGIIHRDISPDNLMFLKDGSIKLMDFGAARYFANEEKMLSVVLKMGYAPEEQYRKNGNQGPWTDVYGLCATIYRCVTGIRPEDALDRLHCDNIKKPSELGIQISKAFEAILMYGLAVHKENRCKDMTELIGLVEKALKKESIEANIHARVSDADIYKTKAADVEYKTQVDKIIYGDNYSGRYTSLNNTTLNRTAPKEKDNNVLLRTVVIVAICVLTVLICATLVVFGLRGSESDDKSSDDDNNKTSQVDDENLEYSTSVETKYVEEPTEAESLGAEIEYATTSLEKATYFSGASASSVLPDQAEFNYSASNVLIDNDACWCENNSNAGVGEWIKLELPREQLLSGLKIINGYAGTATQYTENGKLKKITIEISTGQTVSTTLNVFSVDQRNTIQYIDFTTPVATSYVKIYIDSVVEGNCKDTCLTYVAPY